MTDQMTVKVITENDLPRVCLLNDVGHGFSLTPTQTYRLIDALRAALSRAAWVPR